jgi:acyl dehydratase
MSVNTVADVEFGEDLTAFHPDVSLDNVKAFCDAVGWDSPRFLSHEAARELGLAGAIVPGVMSQGFLAAMIHQWCPAARVQKIDTVFRAPVFSDSACNIAGVVTDIDEETGVVEIDLTVTNEAAETRVLGTAKVLIPTS